MAKANQTTLYRATGDLNGYKCVGLYHANKDDARTEAKEHGWKLGDIENIKVKDVKAALLAVLNHPNG